MKKDGTIDNARLLLRMGNKNSYEKGMIYYLYHMCIKVIIAIMAAVVISGGIVAVVYKTMNHNAKALASFDKNQQTQEKQARDLERGIEMLRHQK